MTNYRYSGFHLGEVQGGGGGTPHTRGHRSLHPRTFIELKTAMLLPTPTAILGAGLQMLLSEDLLLPILVSRRRELVGLRVAAAIGF